MLDENGDNGVILALIYKDGIELNQSQHTILNDFHALSNDVVFRLVTLGGNKPCKRTVCICSLDFIFIFVVIILI